MSLRDEPVILEFYAQCKRVKVEMAEWISDGKCSSHDDYKLYCGKKKGITVAMELMEEVITKRITKMDGSDEDESE